MENKIQLAAVGDNCMDVYQSINKAYPGGNPVNVAVYFTRLGGSASYTGVVGTDRYGALMKESIHKMGVDISNVHELEGSTAITYVELVNGERIFGDYEEGVLADFHLSDADISYIGKHDMMVTGLWGNVHGDLARIKETGIPIAFDAATRPEDEAAKIALPSVDYFFFASDDGDTPALRERMMELQSQGPQIVVCTLGAQGSVAYDGKTFTSYGIVPCKVVDTMGAGDSYIAGFLKSILENKPIRSCMEAGAQNAGITLGYQGAW